MGGTVKKRSKRNAVLFVVFSVLIIWSLIAPLLAGRLIVEKKLARADAILVLSGSAVYRERTAKAADLYRRGVSKKIFLTDDGGQAGWSAAEQKNPSFVELSEKDLIRQGVAPEDIEILDEKVFGTIDEARLLRRTAAERNLRSVLIVTSVYHSRRALWTFEKVLAETEIGIETAAPGAQTPNIFFWWLSPPGWSAVGGEYAKGIYYRLKY